MVLLSQRMSLVKPSATLAVTQRAAAMKREGKDVISLGIGEPDFDTPSFVIDAAYKALNEGKTRYANVAGVPELRSAVAEMYAHRYHTQYKSTNVIVSTGAKQVLFNSLLSILNKGDKVAIPAPYWVSYVDIVRLCEADSLVIDCSDNEFLKLTPAKLEEALKQGVKALILNFPSNPTGVSYTYRELEEFATVLKRYPDVLIISDEIYEYLIFDGISPVSFAQFYDDFKDRMLIVNGLSKSHCMTGLRIGYGLGPQVWIDAMDVIQSQSTTSAATPFQWAALEAIRGDWSFIQKNNKIFQKRRDFVLEKLSTVAGLRCIKPSGAFYVYVCCQDLMNKKINDRLIASDKDFALFLLEEYGVAVVFGEAFGLSPYFRISFALSDELLGKALARIAKACHDLSLA